MAGKITIVRRRTIRGVSLALFGVGSAWFVAVLHNGVVYCERHASLMIAYREWCKAIFDLLR